MAKNINVNLQFTANTQQVKAQLQSVQQQLIQIANTSLQPQGIKGITTELVSGVNAAKQLGVALQSATSTETGVLNIQKFNTILKQSGTSLATYQKQLSALGPAGQQAFQQVTQSILNAQIPLQRTNTMVNKMVDTLANTARWQIASAALGAITTGFSNIVQYAEDLDRSLNDIRIVSNSTAQDMDKFTIHATKMAKELKTSTLDYTKAALTFYQQGLDDSAVKERTDVILKLANIVQENAETVSEWMTAIWNNYDDGTKSLESFADVLAKLGAATASSADEIAQGLKKFSAVADTVGLSYEYAASALATITAETRQSADVVGTALKTLFSRIQDLELGKTLEDGVTLGRYSEGLATVGVNVLDATGNLKDMDTILDDLGDKWDRLTDAQKVSLAQTVGGIRQYNQLIALMDNWDFFESNVNLAKSAEGTLNAQQAIYEESIAASKKALQTNLEDLYQDLLDDKLLKGFIDGVAELVHGFNFLVESVGGLTGILSLAGVLIQKFAGDAIVTKLANTANQFKAISENAQASAIATKQEALELSKMTMASDSLVDKVRYDYNVKLLEIQQEILNLNRSLTEQETQRLQITLDNLKAQQETTIALAEQAENMKNGLAEDKELLSSQRAYLGTRSKTNKKGPAWSAMNSYENDIKNIFDLEKAIEGAKSTEEIEKLIQNNSWSKNNIEKGKKMFGTSQSKSKLKKALDAGDLEGAKAAFKNKDYKTDRNKNFIQQMKRLGNVGRMDPKQQEEYNEVLEQYGDNVISINTNQEALNTTFETTQKNISNQAKNWKNLKTEIQEMNKIPLGAQFMEVFGAVSSLTMGLSSLTSAFKTLASGDGSFENILSAITSLGIGLPMLITGFDNLRKVTLLTNLAQKAFKISITEEMKAEAAATLVKEHKNLLEKAGIVLSGAELTAEEIQTLATNKHTAAIYKQILAEKLKQAAIKPTTLLLLAAAAAAASVIAITKGLISIYNKDRDAAIEAAKSAENLSNAYDEVKQSYDNLKSSLADYTEAQTALDKLTKGTAEWNEALIEANQQVISLLTTYPELASYVEADENGRYTISDEGQNILVKESAKLVARTQNLAQHAQIVAQQTSLKSDITDLSRTDLNNNRGKMAAWGLLGTPITSGLFAATEALIPDISSVKIEDILNDGSLERLAGLEEEFSYLGDGAKTAAEEIRKLASQTESLRIQEQVYEQSRIDSVLQADTRYNASQYSSGAQKNVRDYVAVLESGYEGVGTENASGSVGYIGAGAATIAGGVIGFLIGGPIGMAVGAAAGAAISAGTTAATGWDFSDNDYAKNRFFGVGHTKEGKRVMEDYLESLGLDYDNADVDFKDNKVVFTNGSGESDEISYDALKEFDKLQNIEAHTSELFDIINATNILTWKTANDTEKVLASYFENGDLSLLDPKLISAAQNLNEEALQVYVETNQDILKTALNQEEVTVDELKKQIEFLASDLNAEKLRVNRIQAAQKKYDTTISEGAEKLELDESTLDAYAKYLQKENDILTENIDLVAESSVAHYKLAQSVAELREALNDNLDILNDADANTLEYAKALGEVKETLDVVLGGTDVSQSFVKENLPLIQEMLSGNVEAYNTLRKLSTKDWLEGLVLEDKEKNAILSFFDQLESKVNSVDFNEDFSININEDVDAAITKLNQMALAGEITAGQMETAFNSMNIQWDADIMTYQLPALTTTYSSIKNPVTGEIWEMESTNSSTTTLPWIGDNPPRYTAITNSKVASQIKSSVEAGDTTYEYQDDNGNTVSIDEDYVKNRTQEQLYSDLIGKVVKDTKSGIVSATNFKKTNQISPISDVFTANLDDGGSSDVKASYERYHEIKELLSDIERELDLISEAKDRAFGAQHLGYLDQEIAKQQQLNAAQEEYLRQAQEYYQEDRNKLLTSGHGVNLDSAGRITNFTEIQKSITDKDELSKFQKLVDDYEDSLNTMEEQQQKAIQGQYELHDLALEKIEYKIEFKIGVDQFTLDSLEHQLSRIEDRAFAAADKIALIGKSMEITASQIKTYTDGIEGILGNVFSSQQVARIMSGNLSNIDITQLTDDDLEKIKEYGSNLTEVETTLREQHIQAHEALTDSIEEWNNEFDRNMSKFDQYNSIIENYKNIIDLVGKDNLGISNDLLRQMYATQKQVANDQLTVTKARKESAEDAYAQLEAQYNSAVSLYGKDSEIALAWKQQMLDAEDTLIDATGEFQDAWQNAVQTAADTFANSVDLIIEEFEASVSGIYGTLSALQEQFDQQSEISDRYLENYEKTYEINKLNRKINQDIAKTTNAKSQKDLRNLQAELLEMGEEGNKVSQRDIEFMQKKYDLLLAEQALRDAQNTKSVVRLKRDSEGNYGYVYTADQTTVNQAQQAYEDASYNLEKWNEEVLTTISEQIITIKQSFAQTIQEIANDTTLSDEERKAKMAEATEYYVGQLEYWTDEAERLNLHISEANSQFHMNMADSIHETLVGQLFPDLDNWTDLYKTDSAAMEKASAELDGAIDTMADDIEKAMSNAGVSTDNFKDDVEEDLRKVRTAVGETADKVEDMKDNMSSALNKAITSVSGFESQWSGYMAKVKSAVDAVTTAIETMLKAASKTSSVTVNGEEFTNSGLAGNGGKALINDDIIKKNTDFSKHNEDVLSYKGSVITSNGIKYHLSDGYYYNKIPSEIGTTKAASGGTKKAFDDYSLSKASFKEKFANYIAWYDENRQEVNRYVLTDKGLNTLKKAYIDGYRFEGGVNFYRIKNGPVYVETKDAGNQPLYYLNQTDLHQLLGETGKTALYKRYSFKLFDTGGYTGAWGPEGKLAVLHQKELVLNKDETQDFLTAINLLREMQINVPTTQVVSPTISPAAETIQQEVHITAEFPNATNHSEIEEAFRNLNNYATQYVNRKS